MNLFFYHIMYFTISCWFGKQAKKVLDSQAEVFSEDTVMYGMCLLNQITEKYEPHHKKKALWFFIKSVQMSGLGHI